MKIVLLVGEIGAHANELIEFLKQNNYHCIRTSIVDEIDQLGQQQGNVAPLVFTDATYAFRFLSENANAWPLLTRLNAVYLPKKAIINPEVQKKLDQKNLKLFDPSCKEKLLVCLDGILSTSAGPVEEMELEFAVHQDLDNDVTVEPQEFEQEEQEEEPNE
ncbi:MAG TPA: hypothetical protein VNJ08_01325 [Bacteriovoracaceae bacterium]|nr:hypothetical protein [Bacteriovoracaceae bacterium]